MYFFYAFTAVYLMISTHVYVKNKIETGTDKLVFNRFPGLQTKLTLDQTDLEYNCKKWLDK